MLSQSKKYELYTLLARQIGHLTRSGVDRATALKKLRASALELNADIDVLEGYLAADQLDKLPDRRFASPIRTIAHLMYLARERNADSMAVLQKMEMVLGPLGESYRAYWAGIGGVLWYGFLLVAVGFAALLVFSIFVFPQLQNVFQESGTNLPAFTESVITVLHTAAELSFLVAASVVLTLGVAAYKIRAAMKRLEPVRGIVTRIPGFGALCDCYNKVIFLNLSRLLVYAGVPAADALDEISHLQRTYDQGWLAYASSSTASIHSLLQTDPIAAALMLATRTETLDRELEHLSAQAQSMFAQTLVRVREELTILAQIFVGVVIATLVISMYLPIFKMGSLF